MSKTETTKKTEETKTTKKTTKKAPAKKPAETKPKLQRGVVSDCKQLNIRAIASLTSNILGILNRGDGVLIDTEKSEGEFYCIKLKGGRYGFCLKQFIKVP